MKKHIIALIALIILVPVNAQDNKTEFTSRYKDCTITDENVIYSRIFDFKDKDRQQLLNMCKAYLDSRIQTRPSSTNTDYSYTDNSLIITEETPVMKVSGAGVRVEYVYRLDIKDEKIRINIIYSRYFSVGRWYSIKDYYPFTKKWEKFSSKIYDQFAVYVDNLFLDFTEKINKPSFLEEDW